MRGSISNIGKLDGLGNCEPANPAPHVHAVGNVTKPPQRNVYLGRFIVILSTSIRVSPKPILSLIKCCLLKISASSGSKTPNIGLSTSSASSFSCGVKEKLLCK